MPKDASIYVNLANVANDEKKPADAESLLSLAIALDSTYGLAYDYRGNVRYELGDFPGALADHSAAIRLEPRLAGYLYDRAGDYRSLGKKDSALADLWAAAKLDPTDPDVMSSQGLSLAEEANELVDLHLTKEAQAKWQKAIDLYETSLGLPRMTEGRAAVVEGWLG